MNNEKLYWLDIHDTKLVYFGTGEEVKNEQVKRLIDAVRSSFLAPIIRKFYISQDRDIGVLLKTGEVDRIDFWGIYAEINSKWAINEWKVTFRISNIKIESFFPNLNFEELTKITDQPFLREFATIRDSCKRPIILGAVNPNITPKLFQKQIIKTLNKHKKKNIESIKYLEKQYNDEKRKYEAFSKAKEILSRKTSKKDKIKWP